MIPKEKGAELFKKGENKEQIEERLYSLHPMREKYKSEIEINFSNLYEKGCYVLEPNGTIYYEKGADSIEIEKLV